MITPRQNAETKIRMMKRLFRGTSVVALGLLMGCELTLEEKGLIKEAIMEAPDGPPMVVPPTVEPECFNERFVQPEAEVTKKIDILFITDTSGSLDIERGEIANGIDAFVKELPVDTDFRIGVMLAHEGTWSGKLYQESKEAVVLDSKKLTLTKIRDQLKTKLTKVKSENSTDGGEAGLYSFMRALDSDRLADSKAKGFFRDDAAWAFVFVSDENDICARYPAGVKPVPDSENLEVPAFKRLCGPVTPEAAYSKLNSVHHAQPFLVSGIIYNNPKTMPKSGENEFGYGYAEFISLAKGISVDMAGSHYREGLANIGRLASTKLTLIDLFTLARTEVDLTTLKTMVDGLVAPYEYRELTNQVFLPEPGIAESIIDINYCLKVPEDPNNGGGNNGGGNNGGGNNGGGGPVIGV